MGTRGAIGFIINGKEKVTYNHFDSYPSHLGVETLWFIRDTSIKELLEIANRIEMVESDSTPSPKQIEACQRWYDNNVSTGKPTEWYDLLRNAQGDWKAFRDGTSGNGAQPGLPYMIDNVNFLWDSLFCEWAWIINLDTMRLEIYEGFNKKETAKGRYAVIPDDWKTKESNFNGYYGVRLIKEYPLRYLKSKKGIEIINRMRDLNYDFLGSDEERF